MLQGERTIVRALREIASEHQLVFSSFSHDWLIRLESEGRARHVYGFNFDLNSAASSMIAGDKAGLSKLLSSKSIPHVEHEFFLHPRYSSFVSDHGNWERAINYADARDFEVRTSAASLRYINVGLS